MKSCWRSRHRRRCRNCRTRCRRWPRKDFDRVENLRLHEFLPLHFVKYNIPGYNNFLPFRNPNLQLVRTSVSNQLSLLRMTIQLHTLFLRYMNKSIATKNTKVGEIRVLPMPCLEGCLVIKRGGGRAVFEIDYSRRNLRPKVLREVTICNNRLDPFHDRTICSFCNAVLIGMVCRRQFVLDSLLLEEFVKVSLVFRTIVSTDMFDLEAKFGVNQLPELNEMSQHFLCSISFERGKVRHASGIVDEKTVILETADCRGINFPTRIHMD